MTTTPFGFRADSVWNPRALRKPRARAHSTLLHATPLHRYRLGHPCTQVQNARAKWMAAEAARFGGGQ